LKRNIGWLLVCFAGLWAGCDGRRSESLSGGVRYPALPAAAEAGANGVGARGGEEAAKPSLAGAVEAMRRGGVGRPILEGIQMEFWPALLWHSPGTRLTLFGDMAQVGLGAPSFLAYSSPTGIATLRPGGVVDGKELRERWLLAGFAGAAGWTNWDSPWAVFLHERPREFLLTTNGLTLGFEGAAGFWTMMPLYGVYRPPVQGQEMLKAQGLKEKGLLTWEWPLVVARDPLTRLRFWSGALRRFPVSLERRFRVKGSRGEVNWDEAFGWVELPDAWQTRPMKLAPVSPTLALALTRGQSFPWTFAAPPFDFEWPTVYGPWFGISGQDSASGAFRILKYVNATEVTGTSQFGTATAEAETQLARIRQLGEAMFASVAGYRPEGDGGWDSTAALEGYFWQARALPYLDGGMRSNAVACLRHAVWDQVLVPGRWVNSQGMSVLAGAGPGISPGEVRDAAWRSMLLQAVWAVADGTGDRDRLRERWPLLRRGLAGVEPGTWVGAGRGGERLGDGAAGAMAFARLAWLAGDLEGYRLGCGETALELAQLYGQVRGGRWFREQQPWLPGAVLSEAVVPLRMGPGTEGWHLAEPGGRWPGERWSRFWDPDVARFCRDHLGAEIRAEARRLEANSESAWMLRAWGLGATNRIDVGLSEGTGISRARILARSVAGLWALGGKRAETLIPSVELSGDGPETRRNDHLLSSIEMPAGGVAGWPRVGFVNWPTPTGTRWDVGVVRVESVGEPVTVRQRETVHGTHWEILGKSD